MGGGGLRKYCNVIVYTDHCCIFKAAKKTLCRDHFHFLASERYFTKED